MPVALHPTTIAAISTIQLNLPNNHRDADSAKTVELMYLELLKRFEGGKTLKTLHPINDMEIEFDPETDQMDIKELMDAREKVNDQLHMPSVKQLSQAQIENYNSKQEIKKEIQELENNIRNASQMIMSKDLVDMKRVMRRLDMVDKNDVPQLKGKVAASLSAADEILTTELIFSGFF